MHSNEIKKAIIPVAGKGTRFLPATKQIPKEMLPIINRPMIEYAVEEAINSGIEQIIFVTSSGKYQIEDYFDRNLELESFLAERNKDEFLDLIIGIGSKVDIFTVRQKEQLGLGHAISCASSFISESERFAVILADDLVVGSEPVTKQLIDVSTKFNGSSVVGVMEVEREQTSKYGIVSGTPVENSDQTLAMDGMVEKPSPEDAPTNLATPGRYILNSKIFECLNEIPRGAGGEYQLTDAIKLLVAKEKVLAHKFSGTRYDTGSIKGYLEATVDFALANSEYSETMRKIIKDRASRL